MSFTNLRRTPSVVLSIGFVSELHNSDFRSFPQRTVDVPWESPTILKSVVCAVRHNGCSLGRSALGCCFQL